MHAIKFMSAFGAWRYKSKVLELSDAALCMLGPKKSKTVFRVGFWGTGWKKYVRQQYENGASPIETAASLIIGSLRNIVSKTLTPDQRAMTLHAMETANGADHTSNHLRAILGALNLMVDESTYRGAVHEVMGALRGYEGEALDNYRSARMLDDILQSAVRRST